MGQARAGAAQAKLNVDASFKEGSTSLGGVLRNHDGSLIFDVGFTGQAITPLDVEIDALLRVLQWFSQWGYNTMKVEIDSQLLVNMVKEQIAHWHIHHKVMQIATLMFSFGSTLIHVLREKNMAADLTVEIGREENRQFIWDGNSVHRRLHQLLYFEQEDLPYIR
ncbi:hypothetical protein LIER_26801 [Lithospermum erythrorhizon]|uniref:RNase H type-1 domain-containing protein n=1 Tax=Lithospermum erythrorhizon TaxID=34254 RepID=A0AAV3RD36_LITER